MRPSNKDVPGDLYVLQAEHGAIKIGRSDNLPGRVNALIRRFRCHVALVHVLPGMGTKEDPILRSLETHRLPVRSREWFSGSNESRAEISSVIPLPAGIDWPFIWNPLAAAKWMELFNAEQDYSHWRRRQTQLIRWLVKVASGRVAFAENADYTNCWIAEFTIDGAICVSSSSESYAIVNGSKVPIPNYVGDMEAAISLWETEDLALDWMVSDQPQEPLQCCIDALSTRWGIDPNCPPCQRRRRS